ncbi:hypothetical protein BSP99_04715 [Corynebacterium glutamicum]|nr:hypothetical protein BSP99_04715 [Corynebacterium glutamicum]QWQ83752.1 hypothetical protein B5C28_04655 [Corynebacterium glutamicum]
MTTPARISVPMLDPRSEILKYRSRAPLVLVDFPDVIAGYLNFYSSCEKAGKLVENSADSTSKDSSFS